MPTGGTVEKLKPCPFCGSKKLGLRIYTITSPILGYKFAIECSNCWAIGPQGLVTAAVMDSKGLSEEKRAEAVKLWNKRVRKRVVK